MAATGSNAAALFSEIGQSVNVNAVAMVISNNAKRSNSIVSVGKDGKRVKTAEEETFDSTFTKDLEAMDEGLVLFNILFLFFILL